MAYEARRAEELEKEEIKAQQKAESDAANQKAVKGGLEVVSRTGGWWGAVAAALNTADNASGGEVSRVGGIGLTHANKQVPGGKQVQGLTNKVGNSKLADAAYEAYNYKNNKGAAAADKAADAKNAAEKAEKAKENLEKSKEEADKIKRAQNNKELPEKVNNQKGGESDSLPSSVEEKEKQKEEEEKQKSIAKKAEDKLEKVADKADDVSEKTQKGIGAIIASAGVTPILIAAIPIIIIAFCFIGLMAIVTTIADFEDAFGISQVAGDSTGGVDAQVADPNQRDFYERIMKVRNDFQKDGKTFDPLLVVAVYHALNMYDANVSYKQMTNSKIEKIAKAMFNEDNVYSETAFRENLIKDVIPSYLPFSNVQKKEAIVDEVFEYINNYYSLIGKEDDSCSSLGSCTYSIKGFSIGGTNIKKEMTVSNLYVRLMQCGSYGSHDYGGQWGEPMEGEELIPFEKYILGVAYQEIGPNAPQEAFKAQMIAARSYILGRTEQMKYSNSWRKFEQEDGKWVIQVAACTIDQVYCDPDKGCSAENGDGQWKQVHSGTGYGKTIKGPLAQDAPARQYATEVQGLTLVNEQGYIILTDYESTVTNNFIALANEGLDYKQILMQEYADKNPTNLDKANCGTCTSNGEYSNWKQYDEKWGSVPLGGSSHTIKSAGCLVTSLAIQVARSGVSTNISGFNPGTFVEALNNQGGFDGYGNFASYDSVEKIAPSFKYQGYKDLKGMSKDAKFNAIKDIITQPGVYAIVQVGIPTEDGGRGQHWVAANSINGNTITMYDPGSSNTDMWGTYDWEYTARIVYYKVG